MDIKHSGAVRNSELPERCDAPNATKLNGGQENSKDVLTLSSKTSRAIAPLNFKPEEIGMIQLSKRTDPYLRTTSHGMVLVATRAPGRSDLQFPPLEFVHGNDAPADVEVGPNGTLYSFTVVHAGKDKAPYTLAMVDFEPGVRVFGHLLDSETPPRIGSVVCIVPHSLTDGTPDYGFRQI